MKDQIDGLNSELERTNELIRKFAGKNPVLYLDPPYQDNEGFSNIVVKVEQCYETSDDARS